jgi:hypothetical protein
LSRARLILTGHGATNQLALDRALGVRHLLAGDRAAWVELATRAGTPREKAAIASASADWGACFDRICAQLDTACKGQLAQLRTALRFGAPLDAPPPAKTAPRPPPQPGHGGRPTGHPFLRVNRQTQTSPHELSQQAVGDAAAYLKDLDPINPHLCKNHNWKPMIYPGDEINLPRSYVEPLRKIAARKHYDIIDEEDAPPGPVSGVVSCRAHHLRAPYSGDARRRAQERRVEALFFLEAELPRRICNTEAPSCDAAACELYDPREFTFDYLRDGAAAALPALDFTFTDEKGNPLKGWTFTIELAGKRASGTLDAKGSARPAALGPGPHLVTVTAPAMKRA